MKRCDHTAALEASLFDVQPAFDPRLSLHHLWLLYRHQGRWGFYRDLYTDEPKCLNKSFPTSRTQRCPKNPRNSSGSEYMWFDCICTVKSVRHDRLACPPTAHEIVPLFAALTKRKWMSEVKIKGNTLLRWWKVSPFHLEQRLHSLARFAKEFRLTCYPK